MRILAVCLVLLVAGCASGKYVPVEQGPILLQGRAPGEVVATPGGSWLKYSLACVQNPDASYKVVAELAACFPRSESIETHAEQFVGHVQRIAKDRSHRQIPG